MLLALRDGKSVAAIHAGWRGVIAGVAAAALRELLEPDHCVDDVLAAIGPCIGFDAFEVGPEVLAEFSRCFGDDAPVRRADGGKGFVDLRQAIRLQLTSARHRPRSDRHDRSLHSPRRRRVFLASAERSDRPHGRNHPRRPYLNCIC